MSMTVDNVSYLTGVRQSTQVSEAEKQEKKEPTVDVGKTQQSSVSASLDQVNMGQDGIAVTEVSRQQGAEQSGQRSTSPSRDIVEISAEGRVASAQSQQAAEIEQYEAEDLSEYTDSELKQMYYKGEITRQEYEDETGETLQ